LGNSLSGKDAAEEQTTCPDVAREVSRYWTGAEESLAANVGSKVKLTLASPGISVGVAAEL
jgi:hypothetical protein